MFNQYIIDLISNNEEFNNLYFIMARSQYLRCGEKKGVLNIRTLYSEQYLKYLKEELYELPKINISYTETESVEDYDPNKQFLLYLETDSENSSITIIDKKTPRNILYGQTISLSGSEFNQHEHIINTPCVKCEREEKVKLGIIPYKFSTCNFCNEDVYIKFIYECIKCCTQYIYI